MRRFVLLVAGLALLAGVAAAVSGGGTQAQARWVITDLGTLGGWSLPVAINERGQIAGQSVRLRPFGTRAFVWQNGKMRDLDTLGGKRDFCESGCSDITEFPGEVMAGTMGSEGTDAINERGQIIGWSTTKSWSHGFVWVNGKMRDLGTLGRGSEAVAINERGEIIGQSVVKALDENGLYVSHAFLRQRGKLRDLGTLGGEESEAVAINDRGEVIGWADIKAKDKDGYPIRHAFLWANGRMRDLGTLGGEGSDAVAINERGQIVGSSYTTKGDWHAFLWQRGKMRDLGAFRVQAINNHGQIVGYGEVGSHVHAVLWQNGKLRDLGTLGGTDSHAFAINERGQVVGKSKRPPQGGPYAFVWQDGKMTELLTGGRYSSSAAVAINDHGQIVGWRFPKSNHRLHAVLWTLKP